MPNVEFLDNCEHPETLPAELDAEFLLFPRSPGAETEYPDACEWAVRKRLRGAYFEIPYLPRAYGEPCWLFLDAEKFGPFFPGREPEFHPRVPQEESR
jgi:hypothetical protein